MHLVDEGTDTGTILIQGVVPVLQDDEIESLKARILAVEHRLYPCALRWAVEGRLEFSVGKRLHIDVPSSELLTLG